MRFVIPENIGSDLRILPPDAYEAELTDIILGESAAKKPKCTVKYLVTSEYTGKKPDGFKTTVGETVLETFSLQEQALFNINGLYKQATKVNIPQGDYDSEGLMQVLKDALLGKRFNLLLATEVNPNNGEEMTKVSKRSLIERKTRR